jgi:hypothetical protein
VSATIPRSRSRLPLVLLILSICAASLAAQHTIPETTAQAATRAAAIVTARVLDVRVQDEGWIFTYVDFETVETVKGSVPARFTHRIFGGRIGTREVSGGNDAPTYRKGDQVVLFMADAPNPYPILIDSHVYKISTRSGVRVVTTAPTGLTQSGAAADARTADDTTRLDAFLRALRRQP